MSCTFKQISVNINFWIIQNNCSCVSGCIILEHFISSRQLFSTYCIFIIQMTGIPGQPLLCQKVLCIYFGHRDEICKKAKNLTESRQNMVLPGNDLLTNHFSVLWHVCSAGPRCEICECFIVEPRRRVIKLFFIENNKIYRKIN